ncbi:RagB/SusD family nutrient uptake outer membrane protein [Hymenobacter jejuensis]|uniref:RagB/SusD family nutrient uptake outer membrane protein n=1 Tax=Hymenobacter jejuensis TaxID=2502781 RepID=A0A5B8A2L5_9BACT|nr:RagB/SusD family nutrient uptake outer membrane protein [Hymenobacter jejuensis]QDA61641.1 RagB/SusD family nutrient uptake outer membrane protein [Hymenobacter jejuensis]
MKLSWFAKYALLLAALWLGTASCVNDLDIRPEQQPADDAWWTTPEQFRSASASFYFYLAGFNPAQDFQQPYNLENDQYSDLAVSKATLTTFSQGVYLPQNAMASWTRAYAQLRNINNLLEKAQAYQGDATDIQQAVGEAYFFRAYVYFRLLFYYGRVPLITSTLTTDSPVLFGPRASREATVELILGDLTKAADKLGAESAMGANDAGRVGRLGALAFRSRVCLYEGTWQKFRGNAARANLLLDQAMEAADQVISSNQYRLFTPLADSSYKYLFILENQRSNPGGYTKADNHEYILANRYDYSVRQLGYNLSQATPGAPTQKLASLYLCTDGLPVNRSPLFRGYATKTTEFANREPRLRNTIRIPGHRYWDHGSGNGRYALDGSLTGNAGLLYMPVPNVTPTGYTNNKFCTERAIISNQEGYDFPVIRYAEVLLNYAEAVFERQGAISDAALNRSLNVLRTSPRVGLPALTNGFVAAYGLDMRTEIRRERTVELAFEGFRFFDLFRWKTAETEIPQSLLGIKINGTEYATDPSWQGYASRLENGFLVADPAAGRRFDPSRNYQLPLPLGELIVNPQLEQNPGW